MTLRVGELFLLGFRGTTLPEWLVDFEREFGLGGVILFDRDLEQPAALRNVESPEQVRALCAAIHALPSQPLVFVDQEGGRVRRLKPERGFCELPSAKALARLGDAEARRMVDQSFRELATLGIDFNLAPVVDLDTNPDNPNIGALERSFSADPTTVRRCVAILDAAARDAGLGLCLKHYPGLGAATTDSHQEATNLSGTLTNEQLALFTELCPRISGSAVLLSHGAVAEWDPDWPVSVSQRAIGSLRGQLPDALLITDDLQMSGLRHGCTTVDATLRALGAGVDLVCIGNNLAHESHECLEAAETLRRAAAGDAALEKTLLAAHKRVAQRKAAAS